MSAILSPHVSAKAAVLANSVWLIADKVVRMGLGLIVTVGMARHFGPEGFGLWNYAIAFTALFAAIAALGLEGIVVRELVSHQHEAGAILGTTLTLRAVAALVAMAAAATAVAWVRPHQDLALLLVVLNSLVTVFQVSQVIDFQFQSQMRARRTVVAMNLAFLLASIARLVLLWRGAPMLYFAMATAAEGALAAGFLVISYRADSHAHRRWTFSRPLARRILSESWPLLLSGLTVMIYMRMDQVMLSSFAGDAEVGQFSAALRISEVWYFIPLSIATSAFPMMMKKRLDDPEAYESFIQGLYDAMAWMALSVAVLVSFVAPTLVMHIYGPNYSQSASILAIQIWAGVTVAMSFIHSKWLLAEGLQRYGLVYTALGAVTNVALNFVLIPRFGGVGAACATLVTQIALLPVQLAFPKARRNFVLMIRTANAPFRWLAQCI